MSKYIGDLIDRATERSDALEAKTKAEPVARVWSDRLAIEILANQTKKDYVVLDMASFRVLFQGDSFDECKAFKEGIREGK